MPWAVAAAVVGGVATMSAADSAADSSRESTEAQKSIGMAQLAESTRQFDIQNERSKGLDATAKEVSDAQLEAMRKNTALADDYANYNKTVFRPLETGLVNEAQVAGSAAEQEAAAGRAGASVRDSFAKSQDASARNLARMGISANSGRALAVNANLGANEALAEGTAANSGREAAKQLGYAKRMDAASLGRNLPSAQATSASIADRNGNSAVGSLAGANSSYNAGINSAAGIQAGAATTFGNAATGFARSSGYDSGLNDGLGKAASMALKYGSTPAGANAISGFGYTAAERSGGADRYTLPGGESLGS